MFIYLAWKEYKKHKILAFYCHRFEKFVIQFLVFLTAAPLFIHIFTPLILYIYLFLLILLLSIGCTLLRLKRDG